MPSPSNLTRRQMLKGLTALTAGGSFLGLQKARAQAQQDRRFLIVITASGGASIIDSALAIRASESANADRINTFPDQQVVSIPDSPLRAVDMTLPSVGAIPVPLAARQSDFMKKHKEDMLVVTQTATSVNHAIAQRRSITGNEAWAGRTIQECVANEYGGGLLLPNVMSAIGTGFIDKGHDSSLPSWATGELVTSPALWPLSLDATRGIEGAPSTSVLARARAVRDNELDAKSKFHQRYKNSARLQRWLANRQRGRDLEMADLISKLMLFPSSEAYPLDQYGLSSATQGDRVREVFTKYDQDPLEAQAALAFLLLSSGVSVSATIGPSFNARLADGVDLGSGGLQEGDLVNPPIAFDFSHQSHRATQSFMWNRLFKTADGLIELLKGTEYGNGQSMWDRTMIYIATDFGRDKKRAPGAEELGTSHHLNNGYVILSPMARGNTVLGGVDPNTGLTYGFNPTTGAPEPGRNMAEAEIFSGLLEIMRVDTSGSGLPSVPAMRRA